MRLLTDLLYEEGVPVAPLVDDHGAGVQQLPVPAAGPVCTLHPHLHPKYGNILSLVLTDIHQI